jgi:hypothetical protein
MKMLALRKHSNLLKTLLNYGRKEFYNIDTSGQSYKTFYGRKFGLFLIS